LDRATVYTAAILKQEIDRALTFSLADDKDVNNNNNNAQHRGFSTNNNAQGKSAPPVNNNSNSNSKKMKKPKQDGEVPETSAVEGFCVTDISFERYARLFGCLFDSLFVWLVVCLFVCSFVCSFVCLFVRLFVPFSLNWFGFDFQAFYQVTS
jgi:hypothetical protein